MINKIAEIDSNFRITNDIPKNITWMEAYDGPFEINGLYKPKKLNVKMFFEELHQVRYLFTNNSVLHAELICSINMEYAFFSFQENLNSNIFLSHFG